MNVETAKDIAKDKNRIRQGPNKQHAANTSDISLTAIYSYSLLSATSPGGQVTQACVQVLGSTSLRPEVAALYPHHWVTSALLEEWSMGSSVYRNQEGKIFKA